MIYEKRFNRCKKFTDLKNAFKSSLHNDMKYQHGNDLFKIYTAFVKTCETKNWVDLWKSSNLPQHENLVRGYV